MTRLLRLALVSLAIALAPTVQAQQSYTWDGGGASGSWLNPLNWDPNGEPQAGTTTLITLAGTVQTDTNQDLATPFLLNQLNLAANALNGFSITGNPLQFGGDFAGIIFDGPGVGYNSHLRIQNEIDVGSTGLAIDINNSSGVSGNYFEIVLTGALSGSGSITKAGGALGDLVLAGMNSTLTTTSTFSNTLGQTLLAGANALGRDATLAISGGSSVVAGVTQSTTQGFSQAKGVSQALGRLTGSGFFQIGHSSATAGEFASATALIGFTSFSSSYSGTITAGVKESQLAKVGTATLTLSGNSSSFLGSVSVRDGILLLQGNGALSPTTPTEPVGGVSILAGATLRLNNSGTNNNNRLQNNGILTLSGGTLQLDGNSGANTDEVLGGLAIGPGQSNVVIVAGSNRGTQFNINPDQALTTFSLLSSTGTVFFRGANLGAFSATSPPEATSVAGFVFANPTLINAALVGGTGSLAQTKILPFALGSITNTSTPDTFVTYGTNGIQPLALSEYSTFATSAANDNVRDGTFAVGSATTLNSLVLTGGTATLNASLRLNAGALLSIDSTSTIDGTGSLNFGPSGTPTTAYVSATTTGALTIQTPLIAANFAKSGLGQVSLSSTASLGNDAIVAVNSGTLAIVAGGSFTASNGHLTYQVSQGATLNASAVGGITLGTNKTLTGNGTVTGQVTVDSGGTVSPNALSGPGTLTVEDMTWNMGGIFRWTVSSAITDSSNNSLYTSSKIESAGVLTIGAAVPFSSTTFNIEVRSLGADNSVAKALYDRDPNKSYSWAIATFTGGISGFDPSKFTIDSTGFVGDTGTFSISQTGNTLYLTLAAVPEPGSVLALGLAALGGYRLRSLRRRSPGAEPQNLSV